MDAPPVGAEAEEAAAEAEAGITGYDTGSRGCPTVCIVARNCCPGPNPSLRRVEVSKTETGPGDAAAATSGSVVETVRLAAAAADGHTGSRAGPRTGCILRLRRSSTAFAARTFLR